MLKKYCGLTLLVILPLVLAYGCGELGKVDQGRVIAFDKTKGAGHPDPGYESRSEKTGLQPSAPRCL